MPIAPHRAQEPHDWQALLRLIQTSFASMSGRINPPSSMHRLTPSEIAQKAIDGEVWVVGTPAVACVFLTYQPDALYLGKLAVAPNQRGKGYARALINAAHLRASTLGMAWLELETRVELLENHALFQQLGFFETGRKTHVGFDRPTSITFRRPVAL